MCEMYACVGVTVVVSPPATDCDPKCGIGTNCSYNAQYSKYMCHGQLLSRWTKKKSPPLRLLLILQQCMGIFVRNFTRLLRDQIYTLSSSFIEIFLELTKLHSFNHDKPHFTVFVSMFIRMSIHSARWNSKLRASLKNGYWRQYWRHYWRQ